MSSEIDRFEDLMETDFGGYGALETIMRPQRRVQAAPAGVLPNGMVYRYHCRCTAERAVLVSWAELCIVAHGIRPQPAVGVAEPWQADAQFETGYGPAVSCKCGFVGAPFAIGIQEARNDLAAHPYYKQHPDVPKVMVLIQRFLAAQQQAAAQQGQRANGAIPLPAAPQRR